MKVAYRGHEVDAHRAKSLGGDTLLYYSIFRVADGYEVESGFSTGADTIREYVGYLKAHVDEEIISMQAEVANLAAQLAEKQRLLGLIEPEDPHR